MSKKNFKVKDLWLLLCYHIRSERLKASPKKVELVEAVTYLFQRDWEVLIRGSGVEGSVVTNEMVDR